MSLLLQIAAFLIGQSSANQDAGIYNEATAIAIGRKTNQLYIGTLDGTVRVVSLDSFTLVKTLSQPGSYRPGDSPRHTGENRIRSLTLSDDEKQLAVGRPGRDGDCIIIFDTSTGAGTQLSGAAAVPDFNGASLFYAAQPTSKSAWDICEYSREHGSRVVFKRRSVGTYIWRVETGVVSWEYTGGTEHLKLCSFGDSVETDLIVPDGRWFPARQAAWFAPSGAHTMIDVDANIYYAKELMAQPTLIGKAADKYEGRNEFFGQARFMNSETLVTVGYWPKSATPLRLDTTAPVTLWNLTKGGSTSFRLQTPSTFSAFDVSDTVIATKIGGEARVDLYDLKSGKQIVTLTSPYCRTPSQVVVKVKKY